MLSELVKLYAVKPKSVELASYFKQTNCRAYQFEPVSFALARQCGLAAVEPPTAKMLAKARPVTSLQWLANCGTSMLTSERSKSAQGLLADLAHMILRQQTIGYVFRGFNVQKPDTHIQCTVLDDSIRE